MGATSLPAHAGEPGNVTPSPARPAGRGAWTPEHEPDHPNLRTSHYGTDTPATEPARHGTIRHTTGRQTRARAPHHRARAAP